MYLAKQQKNRGVSDSSFHSALPPAYNHLFQRSSSFLQLYPPYPLPLLLFSESLLVSLVKGFPWHPHHQRQESSKTTGTVCSWQSSYPTAFPNHTFIASPAQTAWGPWGQIPLCLHPWFCHSYLRSSLINQTLCLSGSINLLIILSSFSNTHLLDLHL